jgi:hypothetical protein
LDTDDLLSASIAGPIGTFQAAWSTANCVDKNSDLKSPTQFLPD